MSPGSPAAAVSRRGRALALLKKSIPVLFYAALAVFLVLLLVSIDYDELRGIDVNWGFLLLATAVGLVSRAWMVAIWLALLRNLGAPRFDDVPALAHVYAKSWLGRYIPGTAPWILGKIYFASRLGLSKRKLAVSSFLEAGLQVLVMLLVGLVLLLVDPRVDFVSPGLRAAMIVCTLLGLIALWPRAFNSVARWGHRKVGKGELSAADLPRWPGMLRGTAMFAVNSAVTGVSVFLVAKSVFPSLPVTEMIFVIAANSLASALSMIVVFAPGGIGVREALLVGLLSLIMPTEIALVAAVALRLWSVAVDFIFVGLTAVLSRRRSRRDLTVETG